MLKITYSDTPCPALLRNISALEDLCYKGRANLEQFKVLQRIYEILETPKDQMISSHSINSLESEGIATLSPIIDISHV